MSETAEPSGGVDPRAHVSKLRQLGLSRPGQDLLAQPAQSQPTAPGGNNDNAGTDEHSSASWAGAFGATGAAGNKHYGRPDPVDHALPFRSSAGEDRGG